ncbi:AAA family ATPase [Mycobacterium hodleri]|uniref:AAA family ATPase n=1 Tax=Mycolicibacterium hodleri TaxID=49897 RepID=A0A544VYU7_9MYCO|nr:LuxR family transcriptional regulator [Mycolicibacterium hodleri]TQR85161.1 AAA family ATPase [Mycolicibacterium hodleri]
MSEPGGTAVRAFPMRGRADELDVLDDVIANLMVGTGSVVLVEGAPGIGKTRLLAEVRDRLAAVGARSLCAKAFEDQQAVPFALLIATFGGAEAPVAGAAALRTLDARPDRRYWVVRDLEAAIASAAEQAPLAVLVDDVQWADTGSLVALRSLMDGLAAAPVAWILGMRPSAGRPAVRDAVDAMVLSRGRHGRRLRLDVLSTEEAADVARDVLGADVDTLLTWMTSMARGNPFLLLELLRGLRDEGRIRVDAGRASTAGGALPRRLADTMEQRLNRLSPGARRVVQMAAVLPENFSAATLARMVGQQPSGLVEFVGEAVRADLLTEVGDHLGFRHDLLRHAARQTIPLTLRRALERESAGALIDAGATPEEVAIVVTRSADVGDRDAVAILRRAAQTVSRSDPSTAADLSGQALRLMAADDADRNTVVAENLWLLNRAQRFDEAQRSFAAALDRPLDAEAEARIRLSMAMVSMRSPGQRAEENRRSLQLPGISSSTRTQHLGWLAYHAMMDGRVSVVRCAAVDALEAATAASDVTVAILAKVATANVDCAEGFGLFGLDTIAHVERLARSGDLGVVGQVAAFHRASIAISLGRLSEGAAMVEQGLDVARRADDKTLLQNFSQLDALRALAEGKLAEARTIVESAPGGLEAVDDGVTGLIHALVLSELAVRTDDRGLRRLSDLAARRLLDMGPARHRAAAVALAAAAWQSGDTDSAVAMLRDVDLLGTPFLAVDLDHVVFAARIAAASGDETLRQRVTSAITALEREPDAVRLFAAVAAHARGLLDGDAQRLAVAVELFAECERPLSNATAVEDFGRALLDDGDRERAIGLLNAAFDTFAGCESTADARRVGRALHALGVERRIGRRRARTGWESLTRTESQVVQLVADGATNREVAESLWLSHHTVNTHLRNIFAKLGIRSRDELGRMTVSERGRRSTPSWRS